MAQVRLSVATTGTKFVLHDLPDRPGVAAELFAGLGEQGIDVSMLTATGLDFGKMNISLLVDNQSVDAVRSALTAILRNFGGSTLTVNADVATVSIVAEQGYLPPMTAGRMFRTLASCGIDIDMITASSTSVSIVVRAAHRDHAEKAIRKEFSVELAEHPSAQSLRKPAR